jgi:hypothetical protein
LIPCEEVCPSDHEVVSANCNVGVTVNESHSNYLSVLLEHDRIIRETGSQPGRINVVSNVWVCLANIFNEKQGQRSYRITPRRCEGAWLGGPNGFRSVQREPEWALWLYR